MESLNLTDEQSKLDIQYINTILDDGTVLDLSSYDETTSLLKESNSPKAYDTRILTTGTLGPKDDGNDTAEYTLRMWLDEDTPDTQMNKTYNGKISVWATPTKAEDANKKIEKLAKTDDSLVYDDDHGDVAAINNENQHNLRYIGANPSNYIDIENGYYDSDLYYGYRSKENHYFRQEYTSLDACNTGLPNEDDDKKTNKDCTLVHKKGDPILWRIVGVMNNVEDENGKSETRIKLIRDESIGKFSWDYKQNGVGSSTTNYGSNDWTDSQLMMMLNPEDVVKANWTDKKTTYSITADGTVTDGTHTIYKGIGSYYNRTSGFKPAQSSTTAFTESPIDFSNTGLSEASKKYIGKTKYYLGGMTYAEYSKATTGEWYSKERSSLTYNNNPTTWTGYIGLMYPSDYGFGTSGDESIIATEQEEIKGRAACLLDPLYNWNAGQTGSQDEWHGCRDNSWLNEHGQYQWFLSPNVGNAKDVMRLLANGSVKSNRNGSNDWNGVRPVLYLKSDVKISGGNGTKENPYRIAE